MTLTGHAQALSTAVAALETQGVVPAVATPLRQTAEATARALLTRVRAEIDAFSDSTHPEVLTDFEAHLAALTAETCRLLSGEPPGDFAFVKRHAGRQAQQRFPLEALLLAYRNCHRHVAVWVRDAALSVADPAAQVRRVVAAAADFAMQLSDAVSSITTSEYVRQTRLLADSEGDPRLALLDILLDGFDEDDSRAAQLLERAGYSEQHRSFCVAVARPAHRGELDSASGLQRATRAIVEMLREAPGSSLVGIRDDTVAIVHAGPAKHDSVLAEAVDAALSRIDPSLRVGIGNDVPSTAQIPEALDEATLALEYATAAEPVMRYSRIPVRELLVHHARDRIQAALPPWLEALAAADRKARGALSRTLQAYADADMNVLRAAKDLSVHSNTVYARLQRIAELTGKNALGYHDLTELLLALRCGSAAAP